VKTGKIIPFPLERRAPSPRRKTYTLRIYLVSGPRGQDQEGCEIFRTVKIRGDQTLEDLHCAILCSFERESEHDHAFFIGKGPVGPESVRYRSREKETKRGSGKEERNRCDLADSATLDSLNLEKDRVFHYRFGRTGAWFHLIRVLHVGPAKLWEECPILVDKAGQTPEALPGRRGRTGGDRDARPEHGRGEILHLLLNDSESFRSRQRETPSLRPNTRLKTAVTRLPPRWLDGMCMLLGTKKGDRGKLAVERLMERLPEEKNLRRIWSLLPGSSRKMLDWLLQEKGGWATVRQVASRFGPETETGGSWNAEQLRGTPLGMLRLFGLVFVGINPAGDRKGKIATVPVELRRPLREIVKSPDVRNQDLCLRSLFLQGACPKTPVPSRKVVASGGSLKGRWRELSRLDIRGFLETCPLEKETERFYTYMLGRIRRKPEDFGRVDVRRFLERMIRGSSSWTRLSAYKVGVSWFGRSFAWPAGKDRSSRIRQWARELFDPRQEDLF
jgi:hypothetical protein